MLPIMSCHTILYCRKWKECISFYRDVLGFPVVFDNNILVELEPAPNVRIGLMDVSRTKRNVTAPETLTFFPFALRIGKRLMSCCEKNAKKL